ncbi:MAG TPA: NAD(P)/FAD-dependent oxidoreductase [Ktedonobacterales bacterium]|jgi:flavin-dependent dehydrogenase|nr:NAD(P)/FAD-dependent oxidoreductase [Ktedonobacterales bacterium]
MPPASNEQRGAWDAVVIGASFAGLSFASGAAARGLRVLVLERDPEVGGVVRTTGVLFSDVLDVLDVPKRYLMNSVRRISLLATDQPRIEIGANTWRFYMGDVTGMLQWMADAARDHGVTVRTGVLFQDAIRDVDGKMRISVTSADGAAVQESIRARVLVGADGAHSQVARRTGLDQNRKFLAGAEWLVSGVPLDGETFYLVMDHVLAPGYCVWLAPHGDIAALGVAGHQRAFKPAESLQAAQHIFADVADLGKMEIVERKGGVIPVGGRLKRVYRNDERAHALLLGDAAGLCGAATGGGIYPALVGGRLAAHAVANEIGNATPGSVKAYLRDLPQAGRLGHYLQIEDWLRAALDRIRSSRDVSAFYGLFSSPEGHKVLQRTLFETPIISMDSSFFGLIRSLFAQRPALYGSAIKAAVARVGARSR